MYTEQLGRCTHEIATMTSQYHSTALPLIVLPSAAPRPATYDDEEEESTPGNAVRPPRGIRVDGKNNNQQTTLVARLRSQKRRASR